VFFFSFLLNFLVQGSVIQEQKIN